MPTCLKFPKRKKKSLSVSLTRSDVVEYGWNGPETIVILTNRLVNIENTVPQRLIVYSKNKKLRSQVQLHAGTTFCFKGIVTPAVSLTASQKCIPTRFAFISSLFHLIFW